MSTPQAPNTASRDPMMIWLGAVAGAAFLFVALLAPVNWVAVALGLTSFDTLAIIKDILINRGALVAIITHGGSLGIDLGARLIIAASVASYVSYRLARSSIRAEKREHIEVGQAVERDGNKGTVAAAKALKQADGIHIHPDIRIARSRETEHILVAGSTGAGKSQTLSWMLDDILARDTDKALIFDVKGDYTSQLISTVYDERKRDKHYLLAPWDDRSLQWNIAADINSSIDAEAFAEAFIPLTGKESQPYFIQASQDVLGGVLCYLRIRLGVDWGFQDLSKILADPVVLHASLEDIEHAAAQHISVDPDSGSVSPQTQGVLGSLRAPLRSLDQIARYWPEPGGVPLVSKFTDDRLRGAILVFGARADMQEVATPLIAGMLALMMRKALALPDNRDRRFWFVLDELGALPRITKLMDLITLGRSKGLCVIAGTQDLGRMDIVYGREQVQTLSSQFGTKLAGRLGDKPTAQWAAELFGQQRVERLQISESQQGAHVGGLTYQPSLSTTWQVSDKSALLDSDFLNLPAATAAGFFMWTRLTDDSGNAVLGKLRYPIHAINTPYPSIVEREVSPFAVPASTSRKPTSADTSTGMSAQDALDMLREAQQEGAYVIEWDEGEDESLDAIYDTEPDLQEQQQEQDEQEHDQVEQEGGLDWAAEQKMEDMALHAVGLDGIGPVLDMIEAFVDDATGMPISGGGQQAVSSSKKRRNDRKREQGMPL